MREILFQAKKVDNGEWIEGRYAEFVHGFDGYTKPGIQVTRCVPSVANRLTPTYETELVEVFPETVGQATGRKDQNDDNVFEGDMFLDVTTQEKFTIEWDEEDLTFVAMRDDRSRADYLSDRWSPVTCVIIGNIHDEED